MSEKSERRIRIVVDGLKILFFGSMFYMSWDGVPSDTKSFVLSFFLIWITVNDWRK